MAIPLIRETDEQIKEFYGIVERCHFCQQKTRYWHENTNNPVCPDCSKKHSVSELPDWGKAIRAAKRKSKEAVNDEEQN